MINVGAFRNVPKYSRNPSVICCPQAEPKIPSSAHTLNSPAEKKCIQKYSIHAFRLLALWQLHALSSSMIDVNVLPAGIPLGSN